MPRERKIGYVVIGAGYGDEGKGLITDYLVAELTKYNKPPINVRFSGGAQAGHTVVRDGNRHVFGHVGSGTFAGASTFLSRKFIVNPFALHNEREQLRVHEIIPEIEVHPDSWVTTYFDIEINRQLEKKRGDQRHGSCGLGINETVTRSLAGFPLTVADLMESFDNKYGVKSWLSSIWYDWYLPRAASYDIDLRRAHDLSEATFRQEVQNLARARWLFNNVTTRPTKNLCNQNCYVLEGAQGLELDEFLGTFPHVTRSVTGLLGAVLAAEELGIEELYPIYVTRAYKTRHGAGPLPHEGETISSKKIVDSTNVTGEFQGHFRFAPLDASRLLEMIDADLERTVDAQLATRIEIHEPQLAVTCLDQVTNRFNFYDQNESLVHGSVDDLVETLNSLYRVRFTSFGPSAKFVNRTDF